MNNNFVLIFGILIIFFLVAIIKRRKKLDGIPKKIVFISEKDPLPEKEDESLFYIRINDEAKKEINDKKEEDEEEEEVETEENKTGKTIFLYSNQNIYRGRKYR